MEDVARDDGQQGRRTAEQHGNEIQADRPKQGGRGEDQSQARSRVGEGRWCPGIDFVVCPNALGDHQNQHQSDKLGHDCRRVRNDVAEGLEDAAEQGADDQGALPGRRRHRHGARQRALGDGGGDHRGEGGRGKRARSAQTGSEDVKRPRLCVARGGVDQQAGRKEQRAQIACCCHVSPIEPVGHLSCREGEDERRHELRESDEAEGERITRTGVGLPAESGADNAERERREQRRSQQTRDHSMPQQVERGLAVGEVLQLLVVAHGLQRRR